MLVACSLVNLTTWRQAKPAFAAIRSRCRTIRSLAECDPEWLGEVLRPLGLHNRRTVSIRIFAQEWLRLGPPRTYSDVLKRRGCGKYAADSYGIFVLGMKDVQPTDGKLNWYVDRTRNDSQAKATPRDQRREDGQVR